MEESFTLVVEFNLQSVHESLSQNRYFQSDRNFMAPRE